MAASTRVVDLIVRWEELRELGQAVTPEELCAESPELLGELKRRLREIGALAAQLGMRETATTAPPTPDADITADYSGRGERTLPELPKIPGYEILGTLGRGGMGVVYKARHLRLGRIVALKMILAGGHASPADLTRFLTEAQAVAALQHPNIVQIHEIGEHDGLPYFTLEFMEGGSLAAKVREHPLTARDAAAIVERLAEVMHFAHGKGIVHRDLKPANVLLASDGTPKITDFGLAKRVEANPDCMASPDRQVGEGLTQTGAIMGTPSYMAPEQAEGKGKAAGPLADVYALGAILYHLVTGRPPFQAATPLETVLQVVTDDPVPPSRLQPKLPRDLETICLKCLQKEPAKRYAAACGLAEDLRRFQAGEPILARPVGRVERTLRWSRRKPAHAGLVAAGLVAIVAGMWYVNDLTYRNVELHSRKQQVNREVLAAVEEAESLLKGLRARIDDPLKVHELLSRIQDWKAIVEQARQVQKRARGIAKGHEDWLESDTAEFLQACQDKIEAEGKSFDLAKELDAIRLDAATPVDGKFEPWRSAPKYAAFFRRLNIDVMSGDPNWAAEAVIHSPIRFALVPALDYWADISALRGSISNEQIIRLLYIARRADPDPWRDQLRNLDVWINPGKLKELVASVNLPRQSPQIILGLVYRLDALGKDSVSLLRSSLLIHPADFWLHFQLANTLNQPGEQAAHFLAAAAVRPNSSVIYGNLGAILVAQNNLTEAIAALEKASELDPKFAFAYNNLGVALVAQKKLREAITAFQKASDLDQKFAMPYLNLGLVFADQKKLPDAIAAFKMAIDVDPRYVMAHTSLGNAYRVQKKLVAAHDTFQKAIEIDPNSAVAHYGLGVVFLEQKKLPEAVAALNNSIKIDPKNSIAYANLGVALDDQNKHSAAIAAHRMSIILDPNNAAAYRNLARSLGRQKRLPEAITAIQKAIDLDPKNASAYNDLGVSLGAQQKLAEAIVAFRKAVDLDPKSANPRIGFAMALLNYGSFAESAESCRRALELLPTGHPSRARVLECLQHIDHFLKLDSRLPAIFDGAESASAAELLELAGTYRYQISRRTTAVRLYQEAFRIKPALASDLTTQYRYKGAKIATYAGTHRSDDAAKVAEPENTNLRRQALDWLHADLDAYSKQLKSAKPEAALQTSERLTHWQSDPDLAGVRESTELTKLPDTEQQSWTKLWVDVQSVLKDAQSRFTETNLSGSLTAQETNKAHAFPMSAGKTYIIDLESKDFDPLLKLETAIGKLLVENDDIDPGSNLNSRLIYTPQRDQTFRIVATSFEQRGVGAYTLRIREFKGAQ